MKFERERQLGITVPPGGLGLNSNRFALAMVFVAGMLGLPLPALSQQPLPLELQNIVIDAASGSQVSYRISLDNIPTRPALVVEATPGLSYEDIQLEVRLEAWSNFDSNPDCTDSAVESTPSGPVRLVDPLYLCHPDPDTFNTAEVDVIVRVLDYGSNGSSAQVDLSVFGITQVATKTLLFEVETDLSQQTVSLNPSKDTTLYLSNFDASNGAGTLLWAGAEVEFVGGGQFGFWSRRPRRPLLAFDVLDAVPFNAQIEDADLRLYMTSLLGGGGGVSLYQVAPSPTGAIWLEGFAEAPGNQFSGGISSFAANWDERRPGIEDWATAGGDLAGPSLASLNLTSGFGYQTFSSSALDAAVQNMVDTGNDDDGFLMTGPGTSVLDFADRGVAFFSNDASSSLLRPLLTVSYTPSEAWSEGSVNTGVVSFVDEGDNFRWIYDEDQDDILITEIGGICEVLPFNSTQQNLFPYTYSYAGEAFTGLDCCAWQIDSDVSGTTGTGQALFFHNLDPSDPANFPLDTDGDGIVDLCDNCVAQANGPSAGTCVNGTTVGGPCNSAFDCSPGETCEQSQQDSDLDGYGNACPVPEPGFAGGLMSAGMLLSLLSRKAVLHRLRARP